MKYFWMFLWSIIGLTLAYLMWDLLIIRGILEMKMKTVWIIVISAMLIAGFWARHEHHKKLNNEPRTYIEKEIENGEANHILFTVATKPFAGLIISTRAEMPEMAILKCFTHTPPFFS